MHIPHLNTMHIYAKNDEFLNFEAKVEQKPCFQLYNPGMQQKAFPAMLHSVMSIMKEHISASGFR